MIDSRSVRRIARVCLWGLLSIGAVALTVVPTLPACAASSDPMVAQDVGTWDVAQEAANRRCRLTLRSEPAPGGYAVAMPAGCHRAFPLLASAKAWAPGLDDHILFVAETGQAVLDFGPTGGPRLSAIATEQDAVTLTPTDQARQAALSVTRADIGATALAEPPASAEETPGSGRPRKGTTAKATPAVATAPVRTMSVAEVAGRYAVVRSGKDTGCMVTLDDGPKPAGLRAKLAPACRDQGIVIFDPAAWALSKGRLVLTAKRGHSTDLVQQDDGTWASTPAKGKPLVLKRL